MGPASEVESTQTGVIMSTEILPNALDPGRWAKLVRRGGGK